MLHYNYSTTLSHFLSYHQQLEEGSHVDPHTTSSSTTAPCDELSQEAVEDPIRCRSNSSATNNNKSFTIAAILGLKNDSNQLMDNNNSTSSVVNLSVHPSGGGNDRSLVSSCNRLQLPVHRHSSGNAATHFNVTHAGCPSRQTGMY